MESEKELNAKILKITMMIKENYPELSNYLSEMTDTIPDAENPEITTKKLKEYYESLNSLVKNYVREQIIKGKKKE